MNINRALFQEIPFRNPVELFFFFAEEEGVLFLDSASEDIRNSRYSFIAIDPFLILESKNGKIKCGEKLLEGDPLEILRKELLRYPLECHENLPPFQGGVAGLFSYDLCHHIEQLPRHTHDEMQFPDMVQGFYDLVIAFDKKREKAWIFSSGYPERTLENRRKYAEKRLCWMENKIFSLPKRECFRREDKRITIQSNFDKASYEKAVKRVIDYIYAGDVFEVNISQRFSTYLPEAMAPYHFYQQFRKETLAPFSAFLHFPDLIIASASPERFLYLDNKGKILTAPMKGTRPRGKSKKEDDILAKQLQTSEKDKAENVMIVDLMRNDLSKVCREDSVKVEKLFQLESFPTVHQLVSYLSASLKEGMNAVDLLKACFPAGSISGAPKIRAMEIIAEIEPTTRGPYCGAIGYIAFDGTMDCSVAIRTCAIKEGKVIYQAGGAIVVDSSPEEEYKESLHKTEGLLKAFRGTIT